MFMLGRPERMDRLAYLSEMVYFSSFSVYTSLVPKHACVCPLFQHFSVVNDIKRFSYDKENKVTQMTDMEIESCCWVKMKKL